MADMTHHKFLKAPYTVGIVGAAFSGGQPRGGVEQGPARLVEFGLPSQLSSLGWNVDIDEKFPTYEHLRPPSDQDIGKLKNARYVSAVTKSVSDSVKSLVAKGHLALTLGGDHSLAMGTISGSAAVYPDVGVIWVDAHADINTPETTETGNLHGCPVSFLMGLPGARNIPSFEWLSPCLPTNRIVYIGLRDVDVPEKKILKDNNIKAFSMHEVDKYGIGKVVEMALDYLGRDKPVHLSFDVDALDPSVAPATGTPVRGGLTFREGHFICEAVYETGNLVAVDIMEVNPLLGDQAYVLQTIQIGCSLTRTALGETLL
ncbi:arginase [Spizellomyces punctatus DAOM BR117]|uniref:Arginase n=1 Tax=Spizellomyces punctatus (strain DAOM BR117) TaxID=645134 RepID=A0A0L0HGQ7_SPIPD|nr:arginase [Spizellomyces punctatus DAOM BR117]KND00247.1 arginase [Spizellomyces punctatus DAOM BR117]|eukprot:XP_016608286.1 arginase [Spizellomyces punctatus DAOM BR117]